MDGKMKLSIYTPTHNSMFLRDVYNSIKDQPFDEWVILYNHGAEIIDFSDIRVRSIIAEDVPNNVGACKKLACAKCTGDILLELDHDDLLMPSAIAKVKKIFLKYPEVGFVYSNILYTDLNFGRLEKLSPCHRSN